MGESVVSTSSTHWSRLRSDLRRKFESVLCRAEKVTWEGFGLNKISDVATLCRGLGLERGYFLSRFIKHYGLMVPTDDPEEFYVFEDRIDAEKFKRFLADRNLTAAKVQEEKPVSGEASEERSVPGEMLQDDVNLPKIVGGSEKIRKALWLANLVAKTNATVLLSGESGTGKELFARAIHTLSPRQKEPFVAINCSTIPETLIESELFGHEKGAFTDAKSLKQGRFELADNGTLFLDEVGELPLLTQVKVLRFLQERTFERVGGTKTLNANVRIIAATNTDLSKALKEKRFREDLYYRLCVFPIVIPPLRERLDDIPLLLKYFLGKFSVSMSRAKSPELTKEAWSAIMTYAWPGNVREFENLVERALIHSEGRNILDLTDFTLGGTVSFLDVNISDAGKVSSPSPSLKDFERLGIITALGNTARNKSEVARVLGIDVKTLRRKIKEYGL